MAQEQNKIIYSMIQVSKYYDKKPVLKDISISFFYGAKIGVLGLNGSGKSTLLRIFAGIDKEFNGQTSIAPGLTVGLLDQAITDPSRHLFQLYLFIVNAWYKVGDFQSLFRAKPKDSNQTRKDQHMAGRGVVMEWTSPGGENGH